MFSLLIHHLRYSIYRSSKRQCKRLFFFNFNINCLICQEVLNFFGVKLQKIGAIFQYAAILLFNCADCIADCVQKVVRSEGFPDAWNTEFLRFMQRFVILRSCKEYYRNRCVSLLPYNDPFLHKMLFYSHVYIISQFTMFVNIISHFVQFKLMFIFNIGYYVFDIIVVGFRDIDNKEIW